MTGFAIGAATESAPSDSAVAKALEDADPRIRLNGVLAARQVAYRNAGSGLTPTQRALATAFEKSDDPWIRSAIVSVVAEKPSAWASIVTLPPADPPSSLAVDFCNLIANGQYDELAA